MHIKYVGEEEEEGEQGVTMRGGKKKEVGRK